MLDEDSLKTRKTILAQLRDLDDSASWRLFFDRYWRLIYNVACQAGLVQPARKISSRRRSSRLPAGCLDSSTTQSAALSRVGFCPSHDGVLATICEKPTASRDGRDALDDVDSREQAAPEIVCDDIAAAWDCGG
jgi:hypothetical protein